MLEVSGVTVHYSAVRALDRVSIQVPAGAVVAVLGANGAGKTTLLRSVSGLVRPDDGTVRLEGRDVTRLGADAVARLGVAHVPEGRGVVEELTVEENLRLGALCGAQVRRARAALSEAYDLFGALATRRRQPAVNLSGGERQMLSIARALLAQPRVLLLDEPSLGLAPALVAQVMALLRRLADERSLAVLLVEQKYAASGVQSGTGAQKLAEVMLLTESAVTTLLAKAGVEVSTAYLQSVVSAVVAILNVQSASAPAVAKA